MDFPLKILQQKDVGIQSAAREVLTETTNMYDNIAFDGSHQLMRTVITEKISVVEINVLKRASDIMMSSKSMSYVEFSRNLPGTNPINL